MSFHVPDKHRVVTGPFRSSAADGNNGVFILPYRGLRCIASDGEGWEHVSVSLRGRCPNWKEMCRVKEAFWDPEDAVMQLHPARSEYVNYHPFCLHLWRPIGHKILTPPAILVGPLEALTNAG